MFDFERRLDLDHREEPPDQSRPERPVTPPIRPPQPQLPETQQTKDEERGAQMVE